jgi:hypothetical protein
MANLTDENIAPKLAYLLNQLNEFYYSTCEMQIKHPIKDELLSAVEGLIDKLKKDIEEEYPEVEVVGDYNGYNLQKK